MPLLPTSRPTFIRALGCVREPFQQLLGRPPRPAAFGCRLSARPRVSVSRAWHGRFACGRAHEERRIDVAIPSS